MRRQSEASTALWIYQLALSGNYWTSEDSLMKVRPSVASAFLAFLTALCFVSAHAQETNATRNRWSGSVPAEATITVNEQFLNSFLAAIFDNLKEPAMPLTMGGASSTSECASEIRLKREVEGVRSGSDRPRCRYRHGHV